MAGKKWMPKEDFFRERWICRFGRRREIYLENNFLKRKKKTVMGQRSGNRRIRAVRKILWGLEVKMRI